MSTPFRWLIAVYVLAAIVLVLDVFYWRVI